MYDCQQNTNGYNGHGKNYTFLSHINIIKMNNSAAEQVIMGALSPK